MTEDISRFLRLFNDRMIFCYLILSLQSTEHGNILIVTRLCQQDMAARDSQDVGLRDQAFAFAFSEMSGKEENQSEPCNGRGRNRFLGGMKFLAHFSTLARL